jgi:hypothetical protein
METTNENKGQNVQPQSTTTNEKVEVGVLLLMAPKEGQNSEKSSGKDKRLENLKPFKPGESGNPNGRAKGQRDYATIYKEALKKIALVQNKTPEEIEEMLLKNGILKGIQGDYRFYKDVIDRLFGTAVNKLDHTTGGQPIESKIEVIYRKFGDEDKI